MGVWNALWSVDKPVVGVSANPQGVLAAPVGTIAVRECDGTVYRKLGGGSTAYGWYIMAQPDGILPWTLEPRGNTTSTFVQGVAGPNITGNPNVVMFGAPVSSNGGAVAVTGRQRQWNSGQTTTALNNKALWVPTTIQGAPYQTISNPEGLASLQTYDWACDIMPAPKSSTGSTDVPLANCRIWIALLTQNTGLQASGGMGNSDSMAAAFVTSLGVAQPLHGIGWRFSPAAPDVNWQAITTNNNGAAYAQTATDSGVVVASTLYRLRMRFVLVAGVPTVLASVNDGTEIAITLNVGPGGLPGAGVKQAAQMVPYVAVENLSGVGGRASVALSTMTLWMGKGTDLTC
jgi:hypothetical protein